MLLHDIILVLRQIRRKIDIVKKRTWLIWKINNQIVIYEQFPTGNFSGFVHKWRPVLCGTQYTSPYNFMIDIIYKQL